MRILLTTDTIGGVWTFTKDLCEGLLTSGHAVALVSVGRLPGAAQSEWREKTQAWFGTQFQFEALETPLEWMEQNEMAYRGAETALLRVASEFRADLLHANQFCFGALPVSMPKVVTAHSDVLSWAEACRPQGLADSPWLRNYRRLVASGLRGAHAVAAPTRWMAAALRRGFVTTGDVRVIENGRTIPPEDGNPAQRVLQAVSVGRLWDEAKGFCVLDGMDAAMPVLVAGETELEAPGAGALTEAEVLALFRRSSVYVAASVYEPFGLAPLEAALCGCAVVANDIASFREIWGDAALYFRGAASLKEILDRLVESGDALRAAQTRSQSRAMEFTAERMIDGYLSLYAELLESRLPTLEDMNSAEEAAA